MKYIGRETMKTYQSRKKVLATPMTRGEFKVNVQGRGFDPDYPGNLEKGYMVKDGGTRWMPKEDFESKYGEV